MITIVFSVSKQVSKNKNMLVFMFPFKEIKHIYASYIYKQSLELFFLWGLLGFIIVELLLRHRFGISVIFIYKNNLSLIADTVYFIASLLNSVNIRFIWKIFLPNQ